VLTYLIYFMWWLLCIMEAVVSVSRNFKIASTVFLSMSYHSLSYNFKIILKFILCGPDHKMCLY
jgi:hypothetical protein